VEQLERAERHLRVLAADADDGRDAAAAGRRPRAADRLGQADAVEGVVGAAPVRQAADLLGELAARLEHVGGAERAGELELVGERSTTMTWPAPASRAPCTTDRPTPPSPTTSTDWPSRTAAVLSTAPTPVMTAQPTSAACSSGTASGTGSTARSDTTVCSAKPPVDRPG
jgi:hypothetical protein